jgi:hypothetical protein
MWGMLVTIQFRVQNLLSHFLSKNLKTKIYKTLVLPIVLYGYEIWLCKYAVFR